MKTKMSAPLKPWWANWRLHLANAAVPLFISINMLGWNLLAPYLGLPQMHEFVVLFREWIEIYGLEILFLLGFLEALFMFGTYFPGSMAILIGISLFSDNPIMLAKITLYCWLAFMMAMPVNYAIGAHGFYHLFTFMGAKPALRGMQQWLQRYGLWVFFPASLLPSYMGILVTCCGISRFGFVKTLLLAGIAMAICGPIMVFGFAQIIDNIATEAGSNSLTYFFAGLCGLWAICIISFGFFKDYQRLHPNPKA